MDDDGGATVAEQRVRAVAEGYVFILKARIGLAVGIDGEVQHVAGVMPVRALETVLFSFRIEMRACRFEIGGVALGVLVEVDSVLAGREIVKFKLETDTRAGRKNDDVTYALALGVFNFDLSFGGAGKRGDG